MDGDKQAEPTRLDGSRVLVAVLAAGRSSRMGFPKLLEPYGDAAGHTTCLLERACEEALASRAAGVAVVAGAYAAKTAELVGRIARGGARARGVSAGGSERAAAVACSQGRRRRACGDGVQGDSGCEAALACGEGRLVMLDNIAWEAGQSTSVSLAARHADLEGFDALIVMAADQPFVQAGHIDALIGAYEECAGIASPRQVGGTAGAGVAGARPAPGALRACHAGKKGNPCLFPRQAFGALMSLEGDEGARQLFRSGALAARDVEMPAAAGELFCDLDTPEEFERFVSTVQASAR